MVTLPPRVVVAAPSSGSGKTTIATGLIGAFAARMSSRVECSAARCSSVPVGSPNSSSTAAREPTSPSSKV